MKTKKYMYMLVLVPAFVCVTLWSECAYGNASLPPTNHTGAPGHQSCARCHTSRGQGNVALIFSGGTDYQPGQLYSIMVAITDPNQRRFGFSMVARDTDDNRVDVGSWSAGANSRVHGSRNSHVSHSPAPFANGSHTFTVDWRAPSDDVGDVTFYVAANAANGNNSSGARDHVYLSQLTISQPAPPNQPPSLTVSGGTLNVTQGVAAPIEGILLEDADAGAGNLTVNLSVENGSLTVSDSVEGGVVADGISDNGTGVVAVTGTLAQINTTLAAPNGLVYESNPEFVGGDTLQLVANDNGNTGTGGPQTVEAFLTISVTADPSVGGKGPILANLIYVDKEGFQFTLKGVSGRAYIVEQSEDLRTWELLQRVTLESSVETITDSDSVNSSFRYYRASEASEPEP